MADSTNTSGKAGNGDTWEYTAATYDVDVNLKFIANEFGRHGWELVTIVPLKRWFRDYRYDLFFKRLSTPTGDAKP